MNQFTTSNKQQAVLLGAGDVPVTLSSLSTVAATSEAITDAIASLGDLDLKFSLKADLVGGQIPINQLLLDGGNF